MTPFPQQTALQLPTKHTPGQTSHIKPRQDIQVPRFPQSEKPHFQLPIAKDSGNEGFRSHKRVTLVFLVGKRFETGLARSTRAIADCDAPRATPRQRQGQRQGQRQSHGEYRCCSAQTQAESAKPDSDEDA